MHENFQFATTLIAILAGILFARNDQKELRADFRRMEDRLDGRIDKVDGRIDKLDARVTQLEGGLRADLTALRKDYTEFYAEQRHFMRSSAAMTRRSKL